MKVEERRDNLLFHASHVWKAAILWCAVKIISFGVMMPYFFRGALWFPSCNGNLEIKAVSPLFLHFLK
jgi:hypothetical protein